MAHSKILLIEDDVIIRNSLQELLHLDDFEVITAENGIKGLELFSEKEPDLIICDIMMPEMDGDSFFEEIKKSTKDPIPFIFLTAKDDIDDQRRRMSNGADDYLTKPVKYSDLYGAIHSRLSRREKLMGLYKKDVHSFSKEMSICMNLEFERSLQNMLNTFYLHAAKSDQANIEMQFPGIMNCFKELNDFLSKIHEMNVLFVNEKNNLSVSLCEIKALMAGIIDKVASSYNRQMDFTILAEDGLCETMHKEYFSFLNKKIIQIIIKYSEQGNKVCIHISERNNQLIIKYVPSFPLHVFSMSAWEVAEAEGLSYYDSLKKNNFDMNIIDFFIDLLQGHIDIHNSDQSGDIFEVSIPLNK